MKDNLITASFRRITRLEGQSITGPMSPVLTARELAKSVEEILLGIFRINFMENGFASDDIFQEWDPKPYRTAYDHLLVVFPQWVVFSIDIGIGCRNVAACFGQAKDDVNIKEHSYPYIKTVPADALDAIMREGYQLAMEHNRLLRQQIAAAKTFSLN